MISTRVTICGSVASKRGTAQLIKSFRSYNPGLRPTFIATQYIRTPNTRRNFSSSPSGEAKIKEFFEKHPTEKVRKTQAAWPHPGTHADITRTVRH